MISNDNHVNIKLRHKKYNNNGIIVYLKMGRGDPESGTGLARDDLVRDGFGSTSPGTQLSSRFFQ